MSHTDTEKYFLSNASKPVCDSPTHIEAREVETHLSWIDSYSFLVHDSNSSSALFLDELNPNPVWASGISKDFGYDLYLAVQCTLIPFFNIFL